MAKKPTTDSVAKSTGRKTVAKKPARKETPRKPKASSGGSRESKKSRAGQSPKQERTRTSAGDALTNLLESPLAADLLAVGATAALAALAEHRYGSRSGEGRGAKLALKGAVTAAASAMGRRLAKELQEITDSAKDSRSNEAG